MLSFEQICRELIRASHELLCDSQVKHRFEKEVIVPVIVTNATLMTCEFAPGRSHLASGRLMENEGRFISTDFVRFRKSFVADGNNAAIAKPVLPEEWKAGSERTVFIVNCEGLGRFLFGFRAFGPIDQEEVG